MGWNDGPQVTLGLVGSSAALGGPADSSDLHSFSKTKFKKVAKKYLQVHKHQVGSTFSGLYVVMAWTTRGVFPAQYLSLLSCLGYILSPNTTPSLWSTYKTWDNTLFVYLINTSLLLDCKTPMGQRLFRILNIPTTNKMPDAKEGLNKSYWMNQRRDRPDRGY